MKANRSERMGQEPVFSLLLSMSLPAMCSMLIQSLYNIVDSFFVGQLNELALRAVTIIFPVQLVMVSISVGTSVGVSSLLSRLLGRGETEDARIVATHGWWLCFANWLFFCLIGLFLTNPLISLFTTDTQVATLATSYMRVVTFASLGMIVQIMAEKICQGQGDMLHPMIMQIMGAVLNMILDPILIFGIGHIPALGVFGAALATVLAQIVAGIYGFTLLVRPHADVHIHLLGVKFQMGYLYRIYQVGLPSMLMGVLNALLVLLLNGIIKVHSEIGITVFGIYMKLQSFVFMPIFGLGHGLMPIVGYNFGAKKYHRLHLAVRYAMAISCSVALIGTLLMQFLPYQLIGIFNSENSQVMYDLGVPALRIISTSLLLASFSIVLVNTFQALGYGAKSLLVSMLRQLLILLPLAYILGKWRLEGVWLAFPIAELFALIISIVFYVQIKGRLTSKEEA